MIKVAICDDEKSIVSQIKELIMDISSNENIPTTVDGFYCGKLLEEAVQTGEKYDLIYMDIQMEGEDGIAAAKKIRRVDENVLFVFVSGHHKYMMALFQLTVLDFIKKPISKERFRKIFLKANKIICDRNYYFVYRYKNTEHKIACKNILYFESSDRKILIWSVDGTKESFYGKLSDIETEMAVGKIPFIRIHHSYLVNYHQIKSKSKSGIELCDGTPLTISEDRQKSFAKAYRELIKGEINA